MWYELKADTDGYSQEELPSRWFRMGVESSQLGVILAHVYKLPDGYRHMFNVFESTSREWDASIENIWTAEAFAEEYNEAPAPHYTGQVGRGKEIHWIDPKTGDAICGTGAYRYYNTARDPLSVQPTAEECTCKKCQSKMAESESE